MIKKFIFFIVAMIFATTISEAAKMSGACTGANFTNDSVVYYSCDGVDTRFSSPLRASFLDPDDVCGKSGCSDWDCRNSDVIGNCECDTTCPTTYTFTRDCGSSYGGSDSTQKKSGDSYSMKTCSRTGYTPTWTCTNGLSPTGSSWNITKSSTCTVQSWKANVSGAITLNTARYTSSSSSSSAQTATTSVSPGTLYSAYNTGIYASSSNANNGTNAITSLTTKPTMTGYEFAGFYTGKAGTGTQVIDSNGNILNAAKTQISSSGGTATWYAKWIRNTTINLEWYNGDELFVKNTCTIGDTIGSLPTPTKPGYVFKGWKNTCGIQNLLTSTNGTKKGYYEYGGGSSNLSTYGITEKGDWAVEFSYGTIYGEASSNTTGYTTYPWSNDKYTEYPGNIKPKDEINKNQGNPSTSEINCWCRITGFTPSGTSYTNGATCKVTSAHWVFQHNDHGSDSCASFCATNVSVYQSIREVMFKLMWLK